MSLFLHMQKKRHKVLYIFLGARNKRILKIKLRRMSCVKIAESWKKADRKNNIFVLAGEYQQVFNEQKALKEDAKLATLVNSE